MLPEYVLERPAALWAGPDEAEAAVGVRTAVADPAVDTALPATGPGYYAKSPGRAFGRRSTIRALEAIGAEWHRRHPGGPRIGINDISLPGGGPMPEHKTHRTGLDVDIRPVRNDGKEEPVDYLAPTYSRQLTQELVDVIRNNPVVQVRTVLFNDPQVRDVKPVPGHHNHLHVTMTESPAAPGSAPPASPSRPGAPAPAPRPGVGARPARPPYGPAPGSAAPAAPTAVRLGTLTATLPSGRRFTYAFTPEDLLTTARFLVGEAGGRDDADNRAVLWTMVNLYALIRHRQYPTFAAFLRAYSTPLQPVLRNWGAARRHMRKPEFVRAGGTYPPPAPPGIPRGQLRRFLRLQATPWAQLPGPARALAVRALTGAVPDPIGNATQFASTAVYYRDRHGVAPTDAQWERFTREFARRQRWRWVGPRPGLDQRKNAFFIEERFAGVPPTAVRIRPPGR